MKRSSIITLCVIGLVLSAAAVYVYHLKTNPTLTGTSAGDALVTSETDAIAQFTTLAGEQFSFADQAGKVLVLNSWSTWSPYSKTELAIFATVAEKYSPETVFFGAVNRAETAAVAKAYLKQFSVNSEPITVILDPSDGFYKRIGGYAMPETIIYTTDGEVFWHKRGPVTEAELQTKLAEVVADD